MVATKFLAVAVPAVVAVMLAGPGEAQTPCEGLQGAESCAPFELAGGYGGFYRRYPQPPRYYPPYRGPRYAPPPAYPYERQYEPSYQDREPSQDSYAPDYGYPPDFIEKIQAGLAYLGYSPGPVDGVFGGRTSQAITEYQADAGLQVDGQPSQELYASMARYLAGGQ